MPEKLARVLAERFASFRDRETQLVDELVKYKAVLDVVPCPMALTNPEGRLVYGNASYCCMLRVPLDTVLDTGWHASVVPEDLDRIEAVWQNVVDKKIDIFEEWVSFKIVGRVFWRSRRLVDGSFAVAFFHPACAFFSVIGGSCSVTGCNLKPGVA